MPTFDELARQIEQSSPAERAGFRRRLASMKRAARAGKPYDRNERRLQRDLKRSLERHEVRKAAVPRVTYADDLPIHARIADIQQAIRENPVVILCGETGSGKSTQLPKICLELGRGVGGTIGHTQPRRIAARGVASRLAEELGVPLGEQVGYKVRFADKTSDKTLVKLMTDGILLAETQGDPLLRAYDTIIIDEAHERSLNIDLLLGFLKTLLPKRPDLRVLVTSATIDIERYAEFFANESGPAPTLTVEGRGFPVEMRYRPPESSGEEGSEADPLDNLVAAIQDLCRESYGDHLVFMPTEREIREVARLLRSRGLPGDHSGYTSEILPLYGRLSAAEQARVFQPHPHRRVVVATNVAESSITVPNVRYVVDTGTARIRRYSARGGVQRLPIEPISRASADQRAGRCGRVGPGVCVRLYSEEDFDSREAFTQPEIGRTNLAAVILQLKTLGLGNLEDFPLLDPPRGGTIRDGYDTLFELGAIDAKRQLTEIGRTLSRLPVDPRVGRMIVAGHEEGCLREILIIASALELQDPRERPLDHQQAADEAHRPFQSAESDFLGYLKLWHFLQQRRRGLSRSKFRRLCQQRFLSFNRVREWQDIHRQLVQLAEEAGYDPKATGGLLEWIEENEQQPESGKPKQKETPPREAFAGLHRALLAGLLSNIALQKEDKREYAGAKGVTLVIWPGSGLVKGKSKPKWLVAAEFVETGRRFARTVARIDPNWLEAIAPHLVKHHYGEPRWDGESGRVMTDERVSLFGLPIVPRRMVNAGPLDPAAARTLFIQEGLVEGDWESPPEIIRKNRELVAEVEEFLTKTRRLDLLRGEGAHFTFYDERLPEDVYDGPTLARWRKRAAANALDRLQLRKSDLVRDEAEAIEEADFPADIRLGGVHLPLEYHLEPGAEEDGITVIVPKMALGQLQPQRLGWLVPGLLEDKVAALIRSLPKSVRTAFIPVPATAKEVTEQLTFGQGDLEAMLASSLSRMAGEPVSPEMFDPERLPVHLRMNVRLIDEEQRTIATDRDVTRLRAEHAGDLAPVLDSQPEAAGWQRDGLQEWNWGPLPEAIELRRGDSSFQAFPAIVDQGEAVGLRLFDTLDRAAMETRQGLRRLFLLGNRKAIRSQIDHLPELDRRLLNLSTLIPPGKCRGELIDLLADRALWGRQIELPRDEAAYRRLLKQGRNQIPIAAQDVGELLGLLADRWQAVRLFLDQRHPPQWQPAVEEIQSQVAALFPEKFLTETPWEWLVHVPRYLEALGQRIDKLAAGGLGRDRKIAAAIAPHWQFYLNAIEQPGDARRHEKLLRFHFMVEEYRVSLFAQSLGTSITISQKRLEKAAGRIK